MNPDSFCRLCAKSFESKLEHNLFSKMNKGLPQQIKELTGVMLKFNARQKLPQHVCSTCKEDLCKAYEFRLTVLRAQQFFKSQGYKEKVNSVDTEHYLATAPIQMFDTVYVAVKEESNESEIDVDTKPISIPLESNQCNEYSAVHVPSHAEIDIKPNIKQDINMDFMTDAETEDDNLEEDACFEPFVDSSSEDLEEKEMKKAEKPNKSKLSTEKKPRKPRAKKIKPTGEKLYKCHHCDLQFKRPNTRTKHERLMHERDWPFQCEECGRRFTTHDGGRNHMVVHTKIRNFHCTICKASFLLKKHLRTHYRSETHKNNEKKLGLEIGSIEASPALGLESGDIETAPTPLLGMESGSLEILPAVPPVQIADVFGAPKINDYN